MSLALCCILLVWMPAGGDRVSPLQKRGKYAIVIVCLLSEKCWLPGDEQGKEHMPVCCDATVQTICPQHMQRGRSTCI